jgi:hypothetical protein
VALIPLLLVLVFTHANADIKNNGVISDENITCIRDTINNAIVDGATAGKITVTMNGQTATGANVDAGFVNDTLTQVLKCLQNSRSSTGLLIQK